jgi:FkbM family methyltransferase
MPEEEFLSNAKFLPGLGLAIVRRSLRSALHLTRRTPWGLVRVGACFFEVLPETRDLILSGYYEHEEREAIRCYLPPESPVIELGASQGVVSCITNRILNDRNRHVVVEANPFLVPLLTRNRDRNRCKFEIVHAAAGSAQSAVGFFCDKDPLKSSLLISSPQCHAVSAVTLSELIHSRGFRHCTLICDIEGSEIGLIEGATQVLSDHFQLLIVEFHPGISGNQVVRETLERLRSCGFRLVSRKRHVYVLRKAASS